MKKRIKLDADEKELLASVERREWKSVGGKRERARYARATSRKDRHLNRRLSSKDLEAMSVEPITPRLLNMRQAAAYLGCSFWTARDYVLQGLIPVDIDHFLPFVPGVRGHGLEVRVSDCLVERSAVGSTLYADRRPPDGQL